jgi:hypothetical protein
LLVVLLTEQQTLLISLSLALLDKFLHLAAHLFRHGKARQTQTRLWQSFREMRAATSPQEQLQRHWWVMQIRRQQQQILLVVGLIVLLIKQDLGHLHLQLRQQQLIRF